jgi:succinoglycan biosynthesis transport protein ExoP
MLRKVESASPLIQRHSTEEIASPAEIYASFRSFIRRQYPLLLFVVLLSLGLGTAYLLTTPPSYTAYATMIIDTRKVQLFQQQSVLGDIPLDAATVESQVQLTKSETIVLAVIKDLRLTEDPEFVRSGGGVIGALLGWVRGLLETKAADPEFELTRRVAEAFANRLTVKRIGLTYIIEIGFRSLDPARAAQIANAVAEAYVSDQLESKYRAARRASVWLQERIAELRGQAANAERAVVDFKTKNNIVDTGGRLMNEQQLTELNSQLLLVRAQTAEARARLDRIEGIARSAESDPEATVTDTLRNEVITKLRQQYLDLANREADWSARYGSSHLAAVNLRNQMREIRRSIVDELRRIAETYKSDYEIAKQRQESMEKGLADVISQSQTTNRAQVALRELESTSQTFRTLYDNFLQRYMESVQQQSFPITEARVITPASRPLSKSHPQTLLVLAVSGFGGLMLAFAIATVRDLSDRVFRTSAQVESVLNADCIAVAPTVTGLPQALPLSRNFNADGVRVIERSDPMLWHVVNAPFSRFAEAMRSIKVAADLNGLRRTNKIIGVTSTLPNEGKSTIATSFAQVVAHAGAKTILLDCDLRNPFLTKTLAPKAASGLIDVLVAKQRVSDVVWIDKSTNLSFLPAVMPTRVAHTSEILASEPVKALFENLRKSYDFIVVDFSPLAPIVDVRATSHLVDSYVFVVEWGRTGFDAAKHALADARSVQENLLGVVLNKVDLRTLGRHQGDLGSYYSSVYNSRYGYGT